MEGRLFYSVQLPPKCRSLVDQHVVAQQDLIEVITVPGDGAMGIAELDSMAAKTSMTPHDFIVFTSSDQYQVSDQFEPVK